jgi:hypothetical protein
MNEEQKMKIKEVVGKAADELSDKALAEAKLQTNRLWKVLLYCVGVMLAGIAALAGFTGCEHITPEQVHAAHALYHAASGEPCIFVVEDWKK